MNRFSHYIQSIIGLSYKKYEKAKVVKELNEQLEKAKSYDEFYELSMKIDELTGLYY